jgi:hypothetical protein
MTQKLDRLRTEIDKFIITGKYKFGIDETDF